MSENKTIESLEKQVESLTAELKTEKDKLAQYEAAYKEQVKKYNRLFSLFAHNVDFIVSGASEQQQ